MSFGLLALAAVLGIAIPAAAATNDNGGGTVEVRKPAHQDVSPALRTIKPKKAKKKIREMDEHEIPPPVSTGAPDTVVQSQAATSAAAPTAGAGFEGLGTGLPGATVDAAPPDPNGDVGPNNFVEIVNEQFAVFSKTGSVLYGPADTNTLWSGFGGGCQSNNDGDATVKYDRLADRWIISQFSVSTTPYLQCVAVSTTGDPTGSYYRYSFNYGNVAFPDYPKLGVWSDAYYETYNIFNNGVTFAGAKVCAFNRAAMLVGGAVTQQCFNTSSAYGGLLPSDLDGSTQPPTGSPNYVMNFGTNALNLWKFHVDWTNAAASTFSGPTSIPVAAFTAACSGGGTCIPQSGTTNKLDSLADRLMYRLAYRNFGDHESIVVNQSVTAGSSVGIRWYELRDPGGTPTVYQQSTYAPDSTYRWMGSIAMDHNGDLGLGYSASSSSIKPAIRYTGRAVDDPLNTLQAESTLIQGTGSQTGGLNRWGDYSSIAVDPSDDCTFWYTNEYLSANGSFNWRTRIGSFKFPNCSTQPPPPPPPPPTNDFSISASPSSLTVDQGQNGTSTVSTSVTAGSAENVALTATGQPAGTTVTFSPSSVTAGGSSTMTVSNSTAPGGTYTITVKGTSPSASHTATVTLNVPSHNVVSNPGFETGAFAPWTTGGVRAPIIVGSGAHGGTYAARPGSPSPYNGNSTFQQTITVPAGGGTLSYWYKPHCPDTLAYDQQQMQIRNTAGTRLATVMNVCSNSGVWTQRTFNLASYAGQTVVLWFNVHDDGWPTDPTYMLVDDVSIQ
ncbi:MAG: hypothetical protein ACTHNB_13025 [Gaiellaceae bacterium]